MKYDGSIYQGEIICGIFLQRNFLSVIDSGLLQIGESISVLLAGYALDNLGVSIRQLCLILAAVGAVMAFAWLPFATKAFVQFKRHGTKPTLDM